jgi:hypothetical protein
VLVKLVRADGLDKVFHGSFDLVILAFELLRLFSDPLFLHSNEVIKGESLGILRKVDENGLRQRLEIVLDTVLHDVVDINNQLLKLGKTDMHVVEIAIDVH